MSSGPVRNIARRRRAPTPFYPPAETRHRLSTSGLRPHDVIEIISDDEATGQAASVDVHHDPTPTVVTEDVVEILSDDEDTQQAGNIVPSYSMVSSDGLAAATAELERLRAAIQKVWFSQFDVNLSLHVIIPQRSSLKGILFLSALFVKWYSKIYTAHRRPPIGLTSSDISTLPLPSAVISVVRRRFGRIPFTCPTCRDFVGNHEPCKVIALCQLSNALSSLLGDIHGEEDLSTDWTGYFPE
ncbi:hypothetical protein P692DRAFT_20742493 [Suillus brevipes Sb2]|nr:hypothetical protein P692DRAFT_20742493 [Suillus brevipes Sb2]